MARTKLDLQAYQRDILARLKSLALSDGEASSSRLGVRSGPSNWLVSLGDVSEVLPVPEMMHAPLTKPWFMGMVNVRGNLYAVTDFAAFLGASPTVVTQEARILIVHHRFAVNAALLVDGVVGLRNLNDMHAKQGVLGGDSPGTSTCYSDKEGREWWDLKLGEVLEQKEFLQVAA